MFISCKIKNVSVKLIILAIIYGLLCPQTVKADTLPYKPEEINENEDFVSFECYEELKKQEKELLERYEPIEPKEFTDANRYDARIIETEDYLVAEKIYLDERKALTILSKSESEIKLNVVYSSNEETNVSTIEIKDRSASLLLLDSKNMQETEASQNKESAFFEEAGMMDLASVIKDIFYTFERIQTYKYSKLLSGALEESVEKLRLLPLKSSVIDSDFVKVEPLCSGMAGKSTPWFIVNEDDNGYDDMQHLAFLLNALPGLLDNSFNGSFAEASEITEDVENNDFSSMFKESETEDDRPQIISAVRDEIYNFIESQKKAADLFYDDIAPYYEILMSDLKKAHWLWLIQGIDPNFYFAGANGVVDSEEMRSIIEESIEYLYKNNPSDPALQDLWEDIMELEKRLREEYVDPALELFRERIKKASHEFYQAVEEDLKILMYPSVTDTDGSLEVIIVLPKEPAE